MRIPLASNVKFPAAGKVARISEASKTFGPVHVRLCRDHSLCLICGHQGALVGTTAQRVRQTRVPRISEQHLAHKRPSPPVQVCSTALPALIERPDLWSLPGLQPARSISSGHECLCASKDTQCLQWRFQMKFGKRLASEASRRWRPFYLDYKTVKRAIQHDVRARG